MEEGASRKGETTFSVYQCPCYLLQQALNHLFKCFGLGTEDTEQVVPTTSISTAEDADQENSNSSPQNFEFGITRVMVRRGRPGLSPGSGGQTN